MPSPCLIGKDEAVRAWLSSGHKLGRPQLCVTSPTVQLQPSRRVFGVWGEGLASTCGSLALIMIVVEDLLLPLSSSHHVLLC